VSRALISLLSVAAGLIVGVVAVTALSSSDETPAGVEPDQQAGVQPAPVQGPAELLTGFNLTAYTTDGFAGAEVEQELARLKGLGSNTVVFVPTWYMKRADSNRIEAGSISQEGEVPTPDSLASAWQPNVDALAALSDQWGLPVLLTEIGYPSQAGSTAHPWEVRDGDPPDQELQAMAYQAAFDAFAGQPWLRGILWWSWRADPNSQEKEDVEYTPEGKQAENVFSPAQAGPRQSGRRSRYSPGGPNTGDVPWYGWGGYRLNRVLRSFD
jgi:hypothetical protein